MRLIPIEFKKLRKHNCASLIQSYFGYNYAPLLNNILKDRYFTPTKLISLCEKYDNKTVEYFFNNVLKNIILSKSLYIDPKILNLFNFIKFLYSSIVIKIEVNKIFITI